jgi:O-antigen ligase
MSEIADPFGHLTPPSAARPPMRPRYQDRHFNELQTLTRAVLFFMVLFHMSDLWVWPHTYLGQGMTSYSLLKSRLEGLLEIVCFGFAILNWRNVLRTMKFMLPIYIVIGFYGVHEFLLVHDLVAKVRLIAVFFEIATISGLVLLHDGRTALYRYIVVYAAAFTLVNYLSLLVPSISIMQGPYHGGLLRGFTPHKNDLGSYALLFAVICGFNIDKSVRRTAIITTFGLVGLVMLSGSVQALILGITLGATGFYLRVNRRLSFISSLLVGILVATFLVLSALLSSVYGDEILSLFGRDATLTGRTYIWSYFFKVASQRPWVGYGIGDWFRAAGHTDILKAAYLPQEIGSAHSAYLEVYLSLGIPGVILFGLLCVLCAKRMAVNAMGPTDQQDVTSILLAAAALIGGFSAAEKLFLPRLGWMCFMLAVACLAPSWSRARRPARFRKQRSVARQVLTIDHAAETR